MTEDKTEKIVTGTKGAADWAEALNSGDAKIQAPVTTEAEEEMIVHVTDSGIEYTKHEYEAAGVDKRTDIKLFRSFAPARLVEEGETSLEYSFRRKVMKASLKEKKKGMLSWKSTMFDGKKIVGVTNNPKNRKAMKDFEEKQAA